MNHTFTDKPCGCACHRPTGRYREPMLGHEAGCRDCEERHTRSRSYIEQAEHALKEFQREFHENGDVRLFDERANDLAVWVKEGGLAGLIEDYEKFRQCFYAEERRANDLNYRLQAVEKREP